MNQDFINSVSEKVVRKLDASQYGAKYAGMELDVYVNAPGVLRALRGGRGFTETPSKDADGNVVTKDGKVLYDTHYDPMPIDAEWERMRRVVQILYGLTQEQVENMEDDLLEWLWSKGLEARRVYLDELKN